MHRTEGENNVSNLFTDGPPGTTVEADWLNSVQEEIANVIEGAGLAVSTKTQDTTRDQMYQAIQSITQKVDYTVYNQTTFEALFTRTGANAYDINSNYRSVYFRNIGSGYSFQNVLSGGDAWGDILTKNCTSLEFENGAYINFGDFPGAIEVETDDCLLKNVDVRGEGTAAAVTESYRLAAHRVTFDNCKTSNRNGNVDFVGFDGSGTVLHNITSKYVNCSVYAIDGSDKLYGFKDCMNLSNCVVYDIDGSGDIIYGFEGCKQLSICYANDIEHSAAASAFGFNSCEYLSNCIAQDITNSGSSGAFGFDVCLHISSCAAIDIDSASGNAYGFEDSFGVSNCYATDIESASGTAYGFRNSDRVVCCEAKTIDVSAANNVFGFSGCNQISACRAEDIGAVNGDSTGFNNCDYISSCYATGIDSTGGVAEGFSNCSYGAALYTTEAVNSGNDWIDSVDAQITNKVSTPSVFT